MADMQVELPYLSEELDRHGNQRLYVRRNGRRIRLRVARGTDGFLDAYRAALDSLTELKPRSPAPVKKIAPRGSLGWLASLYFGSEEFKKLASGPTRRAVIEECLRETVRDGSNDVMADCPLSYVTPAKIKRLRDLKQGLPGAANNRRKYLSAMLGWAVEEGHIKTNPARDVRRMKYATNGFHTWTVAEVAQFIARHPVGSKPYLALCLLLFTGTRSGDMVKLGRQHTWRGLLRFIPNKTKHVRMDISEKPILAPLAKAIEAGPTGDLTFVVTQYGKPFTAKGFGNWFRDRCNEASLPHCTASPQGRSHHPGGEWSNYGAVNGDLRLVYAGPSRGLHQGSEPDSARRSSYAAAGEVDRTGIVFCRTCQSSLSHRLKSLENLGDLAGVEAVALLRSFNAFNQGEGQNRCTEPQIRFRALPSPT